MNFSIPTVPPGSDSAATWATHQEFKLRFTRYRRHRFGVMGAQMLGVTEAFKRLSAVIGGTP